MGDIPEWATGVELIDSTAGFQPLNVRWTNASTRERVIKKGEKKVQVTVRIDENHYQYLRGIALSRAKKTKETYTINMLICECLKQHMPDPQTIDMLGNKKYG